MARAPFQVLILPYRHNLSGDMQGTVQYAIFARADYPCWQGIAGGGEDQETPLEAARRESHEEAVIPFNCSYLMLQTVNSICVSNFKASEFWGEEVYVIPEYTFGVEVNAVELKLSHEHKTYRWVAYAEAQALLMYEGNKTALWELNQRVLGKGPRGN
jgi:dihydroneopterin triphosphate diphosphatase